MKRKIWLLIAAFGAVALIVLALVVPQNEHPGNIPDAELGMVLIDIADEDAAVSYHVETLGVYVLAVEEKSQIYAAGVRSGDRLVSVNGVPIANVLDFIALQEKWTPKQRVCIDFQRGNKAAPLLAELVWNGSEVEQ